ncbi:MAG TPA: HAMP domain-containing sensor histidine kinase [Kofleriaceae bacterium]|nr:HAMP domain-containing sensor histidine kinase [Kofleriaceae bacterium]
MRSRRAWIYVLSVLALLVPAAGIAYLGAVSYRDEKGAVSAQSERQRQAALAIAARIDRAIERALDAVDRGAPDTAGLGRYEFSIDATGQLRAPRAAPHPGPEPGAIDRTPCTGRLEDCVRELATRQGRLARLHAAQRAEACPTDACAGDARRLYQQLAGADDSAPLALLGLARVYARLGDTARADAALAELDRRFAERRFDGLPVPLVSAALRAERAGPAALLELAEAVLRGAYPVEADQVLGVVARLRGQIGDAHLAPELVTRRDALGERMTALRTEARAAAGLADDVPELARTATIAWRGRAATHQPARTLIYRRRADGGTTGIAVDAAMLEQAAGHEPGDDVAPDVRALVLPAGALPPHELRPLAQVPLGEALPHLAVALVDPITDPDPLDEVIRERSSRHVIYTSALAIALGLGLLATIRGAARARELARLKSDFVSTVSHELKTPLTSIRMFAEMLEQGVAQGDPAKMARYHGVIVQESQRLGLLIANLLDYAQIERGTRRYAPTGERVGPLARHAVTTFETLRDPERGARNPIELAVSPEAMTAEVLVDRDVVVGAVLNLLANAAKYGGGERAIEVSAGADELAAWIAVRDHGPGIPAHEQARIFREFYRAPEAYRSGVEGTGLGLALVKRHVEALGGTVAVSSTLGEGATFTIRLPRAPHEPEVAA